MTNSDKYQKRNERRCLNERKLNDIRANRCSSIFLSLAPALLFIALATVRLDAQGLYYDEVHQATGAFGYLRSVTRFFGSSLLETLHRYLFYRVSNPFRY